MTDQAHGLRQMFAHARTRVIPIVSNPHLAFGGVALERLCTALGELGLHTLVVDADDRAPAPLEWSMLEVADGIEQLAPRMSYLAARGLPLRFVDAHGSTAGFLDAVAEAAPHAGVVLVHANAYDLCRLFAQRAVRPLLLADDRPNAVTHAYASMKLLASRAALMAYDLLLTASASSPRTERIAAQLSRCADIYLGAVLHDWAQIDPADDSTEVPSVALRRLVRALLAACDPETTPLPASTVPNPIAALWSRPAVDAACRHS